MMCFLLALKNILSSNLSSKEFKDFSIGNNSETGNSNELVAIQNTIFDNKTPLENLEESFSIIQNELAIEILEKVKLNSWQFFEDLVIDLMVD